MCISGLNINFVTEYYLFYPLRSFPPYNSVCIAGLHLGTMACSYWTICHHFTLYGGHREPWAGSHVRRVQGPQWGPRRRLPSLVGPRLWHRFWWRVWRTDVLPFSYAWQWKCSLVVRRSLKLMLNKYGPDKKESKSGKTSRCLYYTVSWLV